MNDNKINKKLSIRKIIKSLIWIILVFSLFYYVIVVVPRDYCKEYKKDSFSGKILKKYIDTAEHNYKMLVYTKNGKVDSNNFDSDFSGFYDYIKINDSICKIKNSFEIKIINRDTSFMVNECNINK